MVSRGRRAGSWKLPRQGAIALFNHDIHPSRIHDLTRNSEFISELQFPFGYLPTRPHSVNLSFVLHYERPGAQPGA
jgi:hypothetical protein